MRHNRDWSSLGSVPFPEEKIGDAGGDWSVVVRIGELVAGISGRRHERPHPNDAPEAGALFLGKYLIERELGHGAQGTAWLATHTGLRRAVVLKAVATSTGETVRREASILASLDHPHIIRVHDVETTPRAAYIAMEYASAGSLADHLATGSVARRDARRFLAHTLDALAFVHAHGVLHRDVKPSNILLTLEGDAKLADFGVARAGGGGTIGAGTPLYLAPEVRAGEPASPASDLYALGLVAREMLGDEAWLARAIAENPGERYPNAREMLRALEASAE